MVLPLLLACALLLPSATVAAAPGPIAPRPAPTGVTSVFVRAPAYVDPSQPVRVLVALHGMGGSGEEFARDLIDQSSRNGWLLVAPTIQYGDWTDPAQVAREDPALMRWLAETLDGLPDRTGLTIRKRVFLLGHSRGAQLATRFALFYPERVAGVAALSAGTYTLPSASGPQGRAAAFPYGVADMPRLVGHTLDPGLLKAIPFMVGVGSEDNNPQGLPRSWDPYIGTTRVQRAQAFQQAMRALGAPVQLALFKGAQHALTAEMRNRASSFLRAIAAPPGPIFFRGQLPIAF